MMWKSPPVEVVSAQLCNVFGEETTIKPISAKTEGIAYEVTTERCRRYVAKLQDVSRHSEAAVPKFLQNLGYALSPDIVWSKASCSAGYRIIVFDVCPGDRLAGILPASKHLQESIGVSLADALKRLHKVRSPVVGLFDADGGAVKAWRSCPELLLLQIRQAMRLLEPELNRFEIVLRERISNLVADVHEQIPYIQSVLPSVIHGDIGFTNVFVNIDNRNTVGIMLVDWEWARGFDPLFDLVRFAIESSRFPTMLRACLRTYCADDVEDDVLHRLSLYTASEIVLHFGWSIGEKRPQQVASTEFFKQHPTVASISDWYWSLLRH